jgi:hypothetical protein
VLRIVLTAWVHTAGRYRPAYLQPAADAVRFGYLCGERGGIVAHSSASEAGGSSHGSGPDGASVGHNSGGSGGGSSSTSVSPEGAVFLGLDPESGAPVFAADLGPPPPLMPDASWAAAAAAAAGFPQEPAASSTSAGHDTPQVGGCRYQPHDTGGRRASKPSPVQQLRGPSITGYAVKRDGYPTTAPTPCRGPQGSSNPARSWRPGRPNAAMSGWTSAGRAPTWRQVRSCCLTPTC